MKNWYLMLAAVAAIFMSSCGKATVESETSRWKSNQQLLDKLSGEYPGFKTALMQTKDDAAAKMKSAEAVSGDEAKVKAMSEANNAAKPQFVRDLETLKPNMEKLKNLMVDVPKKVTTDADKTAAALGVREADITLGSIEAKLRTAAPANANEANGLTASMISEVEAASKRLSSLIKDAEKTTAANKTAADSSKKEEEKKLADVKCRSCGKMQPAGTKKCPDCTAPID
jgi:hypothetical protein